MGKNVRLPIALCSAAAKLLEGKSHAAINTLFEVAGAPGEPPEGNLHEKPKNWLIRSGMDPNTDSLQVLGTIVEEFLDLPPDDSDARAFVWDVQRDEFLKILESFGFQYYRGGQIVPVGTPPKVAQTSSVSDRDIDGAPPAAVDQLIRTIVKGLPRAMHPLVHRRKDAQALNFSIESDLQDLLHALLRPWIRDIRAEIHTELCNQKYANGFFVAIA